MGDDFAYYNAEETYQFLEKLSEVIKNKTGGKYDLFFSTVHQYLDDVKTEIQTKNITLIEYTDDFFPLNMQFTLHFWNGYYTSRPNLKEILRDLSYNTYLSLTHYSFYLLKDIESKVSFITISNLL